MPDTIESPKTQINIVLTGTGAGEPPYVGPNGTVYNRKHSAAFIEIKTPESKHCLHLDFTPLSCVGLAEANIFPSEIDTIAFSHSHEDHFDPYRFLSAKLNIGHIRFGYDKYFSRKNLNIYAPRPVVQSMLKMFARKKCQPSGPIDYRKRRNCYSYKSEKARNESLFLRVVNQKKKATEITLSEDISLKFLKVPHKNDSVISKSGKSNVAYGFLIRAQGKNRPTDILYLTDFEQLKTRDRASFRRSLKGSNIVLPIWGMSIPFPTKQEEERHMGLKETLKLHKSLQKDNIIKKDAPFVVTHLSDRWCSKKTLAKIKRIAKKYMRDDLFWIPEKDGFEIRVTENSIEKIGNII